MCVKGMVKLDKNLIESNKRVLFGRKLSWDKWKWYGSIEQLNLRTVLSQHYRI